MRIPEKLFSADGHVVEPAGLWQERMDRRFRDRAPRVESRDEGDWYVIDGLPPFPVGLEGAAMEAKLKGKVSEGFRGYRHAATRPGASNPFARIKDQDLDSLSAEVIYPGNLGLLFFNAPDPEYQRDIIRVYNDWIFEFNASAPSRMLGTAMLPMKGPIHWAIDEACRAASHGASSLSIPVLVDERPYGKYADIYEPLWAELAEIGLPVSIHAGTNTGETTLVKMQNLGMGLAMAQLRMTPGVIGELVWSGVPQRHPKLRFVLVECGIGWIASILRFMDRFWADHRHWVEPKLAEKPSFYFHRQFWSTFENDPAGLLTRRFLNVDHLMWGSDFPHTEGTWPNSREEIAENFVDLSDEEVDKIVRGNAAALYAGSN